MTPKYFLFAFEICVFFVASKFYVVNAYQDRKYRRESKLKSISRRVFNCEPTHLTNSTITSLLLCRLCAFQVSSATSVLNPISKLASINYSTIIRSSNWWTAPNRQQSSIKYGPKRIYKISTIVAWPSTAICIRNWANMVAACSYRFVASISVNNPMLRMPNVWTTFASHLANRNCRKSAEHSMLIANWGVKHSSIMTKVRSAFTFTSIKVVHWRWLNVRSNWKLCSPHTTVNIQPNILHSGMTDRISFFFPFFSCSLTHTECSAGPELMRCDPNDDSFCIWNQFNEDKIQNCPPPYCSDEDVKCGNAKGPRTRPRSKNPNAAGVEQNFGGLTCVMVIMAFLYSRCSY